MVQHVAPERRIMVKVTVDVQALLDDMQARIEQNETRLDKQADAIRALRTEVKRLKPVQHVAPAAQSNDGDNEPMEPGDLVALPPSCLMCDRPKEDGRADKMTCVDCSRVRAHALRRGATVADRQAIITDHCHTCAKSRKPTTQLVCSRCRTGIARWKMSL